MAKRLVECLTPVAHCTLATIGDSETVFDGLESAGKILVSDSGGSRSRNAARLALAVRRSDADIAHLVGTNALVFSPICGIANGRVHVVRHIFTSYDANDRVARSLRRLVNSLFVDGYAFTFPWMEEWARDIGASTRKFVIRPPVNCDFYRPLPKSGSGPLPESSHAYTALYMGPLLPSRFPSTRVLGALRLLVRSGIDARLVVATSPTRTSPGDIEALSNLGKRLGLENNLTIMRVDFSENERVAAYNSADVVMFPFIGPVPEKIADPPFGVLEAMACGRVVLATTVLSVPELILDGATGFLISQASTEDISEGLKKALLSSSNEGIRDSARQRVVQDFSYPRVRRAAMDAYDTIVGNLR